MVCGQVEIGLDSKSVKRVIEASKKAAPELPLLAFSQEADRVMAFAYVPESKRDALKVGGCSHKAAW